MVSGGNAGLVGDKKYCALTHAAILLRADRDEHPSVPRGATWTISQQPLPGCSW
jgi:hypothetical protein